MSDYAANSESSKRYNVILDDETRKKADVLCRLDGVSFCGLGRFLIKSEFRRRRLTLPKQKAA